MAPIGLGGKGLNGNEVRVLWLALPVGHNYVGLYLVWVLWLALPVALCGSDQQEKPVGRHDPRTRARLGTTIILRRTVWSASRPSGTAMNT